MRLCVAVFSLIVVTLSATPASADTAALPPGALVRLGSAKFRLTQGGTAFAFSPDSKHLLTADGSPGTIKSWNVQTGQEERSWKMAQANVTSLRFSPDGMHLAVAYSNGGVYVLDWGTEATQVVPNIRNIPLLAWTPDSKTLIIWHPAGIVRLVELASKKETASWTTGFASTQSLACSPDGKSVAVQSVDGTIRNLDIQTGKVAIPFENIPPDLRGQVRGNNSLTFSADGKYVVGPFSNRSLPIWDAKTGKITRRFELPPSQWMNGMALSANGRFIATAMQNGGLRIWGLASGEELRTLDSARINSYIMAFSPDDRLLAAVVGQMVRIWDLTTGKDLHDDAGHRGAVAGLTFLDGGTKLVTQGQDMTMRYWDVATGKELNVARIAQWGSPWIAADPSGKSVLLNLGGIGLGRWTPADSASLESIPLPVDVQNYNLEFSADGRFAASTRNNGELVMFDAATGKEVEHVGITGRAAYQPLPSPMGRYLAYISGFNQGAVMVWDFASGFTKRPLVAGGPAVSVRQKAFSRDGRLLAVMTNLGVVQIWEVATATLRGQVENPESYNTIAMAISSDARTVAIASGSGTVRIFDVVTGKSSGPFQAHSGYIQGLAFSPDGKRLATGSQDTTAIVWDVKRLSEALQTPTAEPITVGEKELEGLWNNLSVTDGQTLWPAMDKLTSVPAATIAMLREKLKPEPGPDMAVVARWVKELDDPRFRVRDSATRSLAALGGRASPALTAALRAGPTPEAKRRIESLLQTLRDGIAMSQLRPLRAIEVLERIGTPEARQLLEKFANQTAEDELKREVEFALKRMAK